MGLLKEFKEFAIKGNVIDLAVGIVIGTAFNNVVQTIVKKVFLPPLSMLTDGVNFAERKWVLKPAINEDLATEIAIGYGELLEVSIDFVVIAIVIFIVINVSSI
jgi:large conductance mechanosensitive channel